MSQPLEIFIIYARKDAKFKDELIFHLKPLKLLGLVDTWHDGDILPGETWDAEIKNQLHRADVIIPLISTHFINSDYIQGTEFKEARQRWERGEAEITPVVVRDCLWEDLASLADLQALPSNGQKILPITRWTDRDEAWTVIAAGLKRLCMELRTRRLQAEADKREWERHEKEVVKTPPQRQKERQPLFWKKYRYGILGGVIGLALLAMIFPGRIIGKRDFIEPEMLHIPSGTFQMGSEHGDSSEKPVHAVSVSDFWLGRTEVTVAEFKAFVDATRHRTDAEKEGWSSVLLGASWEKKSGVTWRDDAEGKRRSESEYNHPVIHVSWNDANAYCDWLSNLTRKRYRLPTEAEWEYAAGNGAKHYKYSWGDGNPVAKKGGNVTDESAKRKFPDREIFDGYNDSFIFTAPVASFNANDFGLHDMSGNLWEWCEDVWHDNYYDAPPYGNAWTAGGEQTLRVVRGGSWLSGPNFCRATFRNMLNPYVRSCDLGFRLAR